MKMNPSESNPSLEDRPIETSADDRRKSTRALRAVGERPIETSANDRLSFAPAAEHIGKFILDAKSPDSLVIGIEGEWGSGKSSFINLVEESLRKSDNAPEFVRFLPWMIGSREGLLKEIFAEITKAAQRIYIGEPAKEWFPTFRKFWKCLITYKEYWRRVKTCLRRVKICLKRCWRRVTRYLKKCLQSEISLRSYFCKKQAKILARFLFHLIQVAPLASVAPATGAIAGAKKIAEVGKNWIDEWLKNENISLEKEKQNIQKELRKLKRKIVVFIDDLDRLEPNEIVEVLRLVRAVLDFPNVVYVLCYSREIVAKSLKTSLQIQEGEQFLEKIIPVHFSIPRPEAFDLRNMFRHELYKLYPDLEKSQDLEEVINNEGGWALRTPRHVFRTINALHLHATPVLENIYIPDMVWLQLVRIQSEKLYRWIGEYLHNFAEQSAGATIGWEKKEADLQQLNSILSELPYTKSNCIILDKTLPGIHIEACGSPDGEEIEFNITDFYNSLMRVPIQTKKKGLGNPQYFLYYFALNEPQGAIYGRACREFIDKASYSPEKAGDVLINMACINTPHGVTAAQILLDYMYKIIIYDRDPRIIRDPGIIKGTLLALSESMDTVALKKGGNYSEKSYNLFCIAWEKIQKSERSKIIREIFKCEKSVGWLSDIFYREISDSKPSLTQWEIKIAADELWRHYRNLTSASLQKLPDIGALLAVWMLRGDQYKSKALNEEIREKIEALSQNDEDFLKILSGIKSWKYRWEPIHSRFMSRFMDPEKVKERLHDLTLNADTDIAAHAEELFGDLFPKDGKQ
jgi:hypothetical protein